MAQEEDQIPCPLPLPLLSLNHVSFVCKSLTASTEFYEKVLGFQLVKRPSSFNFEGSWLFNYGVGIHLLQCRSRDDLPEKTQIDPRDNHISFQCRDILLVEKKLQELDIKYEKRLLEDEGFYVDQLFFHDPDGYMLEICNCENIPVTRLSSSLALTSRRFALSQSNLKMEAEESHSEIALVSVNDVREQTGIKLLREKKIDATGAESRCRSDAHDDKGPFFLDIMDFYL